jgi:hypothetical protein
MTTSFPAKLGISKEAWADVTDGFQDDEYKRVEFVDTDLGIVKRIDLAGPNVMGAMCAFCGAGPMKLSNLYTNHFAKNKCKGLVFDNTTGKYVHLNQDDQKPAEDEKEAKTKEKGRTTTAKAAKKRDPNEWPDLAATNEEEGEEVRTSNEEDGEELDISAKGRQTLAEGKTKEKRRTRVTTATHKDTFGTSSKTDDDDEGRKVKRWKLRKIEEEIVKRRELEELANRSKLEEELGKL